MARKVTKKTETKKPAPRTGRSRAKANGGERAPEVALSKAVSEADVRERAYEIYRRGTNPSDPAADWLQAEQELRSETNA